MQTVTIPKDEYETLNEESTFLHALRAAGVDNWHGNDDAMDILEEWDNE